MFNTLKTAAIEAIEKVVPSTPAKSDVPREAHYQLRRLREQLDDLDASQLAASDRSYDLGQQIKALRNRAALHDPANARRAGYLPMDPDGPLATSERARLAELEENLKRLRLSITERGERLGRLRTLVGRLEKYTDDLKGSGVSMSTASVKLPKADPRRTIEEARAERIRLLAEISTVAAAPLPSIIVRERAKNAVEQLAEKGRPSVQHMFEANSLVPEWPVVATDVRLHATAVLGQVSGPVVGLGLAQGIDAAALLAWVHKPTLLDAVLAEVDACADDGAALSPEQKFEKLKRLRAAILQQERVEETAIRLTEADGTAVERRADADPRALLLLCDDAPEPRV